MKDNYCVIMGGGIGSRFWPFSRESYPKQFLDFFGSGRSLLQMTFDRFSKFIPLENIYVVTNEQYASLVKQQLPELQEKQVLLEPARRNTAPCIAYAAYHIRACNPNANIVVAPSDHLILKEDIFQQDVQKCLDFVRTHKALVTLGIRPGRPETGYGYIQSSETLLGEFTKVKTFTEKPDLELAKVFMESGEFFWNSGIFIWNVNTILEAQPYWTSGVIPGGVYKGHDEDIPCITYWNMIVGNSSLSEDLVYNLCKATYETVDELAQVDQNATGISYDNLYTMTVPLHPGALRYYTEQGVEIPDSLIAE